MNENKHFFFLGRIKGCLEEKEEELKKKKMEQVKVLLTDLKKEEMILRKKMDATDDPEKKAQIKSHLKEVLTEEKFLADALANGELPPLFIK